MVLKLKAKHFLNTTYSGDSFSFSSECHKCAIEKAYEDQTGNRCVECVNSLIDLESNDYYNHRRYDSGHFNMDKIEAKSHNWDDTVIRTIELIKK